METFSAKIVSAAEWETLLEHAVHVTPFNLNWWLDIQTECFGGKVDRYLATIGGNNWLVPCLSGQPWAANGFRIGGIGYGGPLPVFNENLSSVSMIKEIEAILTNICTLRAQACNAAVTFPHSQWDLSQFSGSRPWKIAETSILLLGTDVDSIFATTITGNKRTAIRKGRASGVNVRCARPDDIDQIHTLLVNTQEIVGSSYRTPFTLVERLVNDCSGFARCNVAISDTRVIGMTIVLMSGGKAFLLFNGWDRKYAQLCANELLYWDAICDCVNRGVTSLDLGRSHSDSLLAAKRRWGSNSVPVLTC